MDNVRVRFAPSPTGPLHIGGARTALFNWLFARHHGGSFILRIEDTDQTRYKPEAEQQIKDGLQWLGLDWDEGPEVGGEYGPYVQSQRSELYREWADWLVEQGKAYRCYCTPEDLDQMRKEQQARGERPHYDRRCRYLTPEQRAEHEGEPYVIRLAVPTEGETAVYDLIRGEITFKNEDLNDQVLLKTDGLPTYHLANVVDDHFMEISHIMRGDEWISTAPLHVQLYDAFGWEMPKIAHLPLILNPNGKGKLSKRAQAFTEGDHKVLVLLHEFPDEGYLPQALANFLTNIGWSFPGDREVFSLEDAIEEFGDISRITPAASAFPFEKLVWLNGVYIREMEPEELAERLREPLKREGLSATDDQLRVLAPLVQERLKTLNDVIELAAYMFCEEIAYDPSELVQRKMDVPMTQTALHAARECIEGTDPFTEDALEERLRALAKELNFKAGQMFGVLRVATSGQKVAPPLFGTFVIMGKAETLRRIARAEEMLANVKV